jgi:hypothetical protein
MVKINLEWESDLQIKIIKVARNIKCYLPPHPLHPIKSLHLTRILSLKKPQKSK